MQFIRKRKTFAIILATLIVLTPIFVFSANPPSTTTINNPISANTVDGFIKSILIGIVKIGMPIIALAIIYSGFLFVAARGKTEALTKAKNALLYTVIGAAILLGAWAIAQLISDTVIKLSINLFNYYV